MQNPLPYCENKHKKALTNHPYLAVLCDDIHALTVFDIHQ